MYVQNGFLYLIVTVEKHSINGNTGVMQACLIHKYNRVSPTSHSLCYLYRYVCIHCVGKNICCISCMPCDSIVLIFVMHKYNSHLNCPPILRNYVSPHSSSISGVSELEDNIYSFHLQILANFSLSQQVFTASFIKNHCHSQLQITCMTFCAEKNISALQTIFHLFIPHKDLAKPHF
jgi:hypothetical protein